MDRAVPQPAGNLLPLALAPALLGLLAASASAQEKTTFADHVLPLFEDKCLNCHNPDKKKGGLDLSSFNGALSGGSGGDVIIAGDPSSSRIITTTTKKEEPFMPPEGEPLSAEQVKILEKWVAGGLLENSGSVALKPKKTGVDLKTVVAIGKPENPALPEHLSLEPVVIPPRANAVTNLAASPWAPLLAIAGEKQIYLYRTDQRRLAAVLPYDLGIITDLAFSKNGSLLLASGGIPAKSGQVVAWDVKTGRQVLEVGKEYDAVLAADITADQSLIIIGTSGKKVKAFSTGTGEQIYELGRHSEWVMHIACSPDGKLLATADRNGGILIWEAENGGEYFTLEGHKEAITDLSWRADGKVLASSSEDGEVRLWEMKEGKRIKNWGAHGEATLSVAYGPNGQLVTTGRDKAIKIWDGEGKNLKTIGGRPDIVTSSAFLHDSQAVVSGNWLGEISMWKVEDGAELASLSAHPPSIASRIAQAEAAVPAATKKIEEANAALAAAAKQRTDSEAQLAAARAAAAEGMKKREAALAVVKQKEAENVAATAAKTDHTKERDRLKAELAQRAEQLKKIAAAEAQRAEIQKTLEGQQAQVTALAKAAADAKAASDAKPEDANLKTAADQSAAAHASTVKALEGSRAQAGAKDGEITALKKALPADPAAALAQHEAKIQELDAALAATAKLIADNQQIAQANASQQGANDQRIKDLETQVIALRKTEAERKTAAEGANGGLAWHQKELAFWKAQAFNAQRMTKVRVLDESKATAAAAADAIKQLEAQIATAQGSIANAQKEIPALEAQHKAATADVPNKTAAAQQAMAAKAPKEAERNQTAADLEAKTKAHAAAAAAVAPAQAALDGFVAARTGLQQKVDAGTGILAETDKQLAAAKGMQGKTTAALAKVDKQIQLASAAKLQADGNLAGTNQQLASTKAEFDATPEAEKAERDALQAALTRLTEVRNLADQQLKKSLEHIAALQKTRAERAAPKAAADKAATDLGNARNAQAAALEAAKKAVVAWDADENNKKKRAALDADKNAKVAAVAPAKAALDAATALLVQRDATLKQMADAAAAAEKARVEAAAKPQQLATRLEQLRASIPAHQAKIKDLQAQLAKTKEEQAKLQKEVAALQPEVDKMKADYLAMLPK